MGFWPLPNFIVKLKFNVTLPKSKLLRSLEKFPTGLKSPCKNPNRGLFQPTYMPSFGNADFPH